MLRRRFFDRVRAATATMVPMEIRMKRVALERPDPTRLARPPPVEGAMVPSRLRRRGGSGLETKLRV